MMTVLVAVVGCVRAGFDVPVDGSGPFGDVAGADGNRDGAKADGWADAPVAADGDGGAAPGTWVTIVKGTFTMGPTASEPCRSANEVQHQVTLTHGFEIQATEVTQAQFQSLMGYNPSYFGPGAGGADCGTDCPVEMVSWHESAAYCNALSQEAGKTPCYTCSGSGASVACQEASAYGGQKIYTCPGYRLPTEAEWEYAYRAGTQTAFYNGANDPAQCNTCSSTDANLDKIGWYCANSGNTTHAVGQKAANDWGLHDMAGNVWEWCHDWYQTSPTSSAVTDPVGSGSVDRVLRGGSWESLAYDLRAASRGGDPPTFRIDGLGFRCCRSILP